MSCRCWDSQQATRSRFDARGERVEFRRGWSRVGTQQATSLFRAVPTMAGRRIQTPREHARFQCVNCQRGQSWDHQWKLIPTHVPHKFPGSSFEFGSVPLSGYLCKQTRRQEQRTERSIGIDPSSKLIRKGGRIASVGDSTKPIKLRASPIC
jgi:hypothetical protein